MRHSSSLLRRSLLLGCAGLLALLSGCTTLDRGAPPALEKSATWVVLPFANHTETPLAGQRAEAIAGSLLQARTGGTVLRPPAGSQQEALFDAGDQRRQEEALAWAREQQARYALTGSVEEWRYKVGVDGEPAVGVSLRIVEVATGRVLWAGSGGKSGWSREALAGVAHKLVRELLQSGLAGAR